MSLKYKEVPGRILPQVWGSSEVTDRVEVKHDEDKRTLEGSRLSGGLMNKVYSTPTSGLRGIVQSNGQEDIEFPATGIKTTPGNSVVPNRVRVNQRTAQWIA
jgi:hypothetical protein